MKYNNIFLLNNLEINKFLKIILLFQLGVLGIIGLEYLGLTIPLLRPLIGFIYLTFIPGALILRNLKIKNITGLESILYMIGISLSTLMFIGFAINTIYPILGILKPLSLESILITTSALVFFLSILSYVRDEGVSKKEYLHIKNIKLIVLLMIMPFLAIIGSYLMNFYNIYSLTFILLIIISLISILSLSKKFDTNIYPLTIFIISISLLYHTSLISMHITGWDINVEYYLANLVIKNSYWNMSIVSDYNSMLSVVMLGPIYSTICKISITWVFKIIYPFFFSFVPLGLYFIIKKYTSPKVAFLSVFYFMAGYMFYGEMIQLARQEIAELFFILLILLMISDNLDKIKRSFLFIVFGISLIVSHYGLAYIYMFYVSASVIFLFLIMSLKNYRLPYELESKIKNIELNELTLTTNFALLFIVFGIMWYIYTSEASSFESLVNVFNRMITNVFTELLSPDSVQGLSIATSNENLIFHQLTKYLFLVSQFLIFIGATTILSKKTNFKIEYKLWALLSLLLAILGLILPYFSNSLQTSRFFQITLLLLSPFFVLGTMKLFEIISKVTKFKIEKDVILKLTAIFLIFFFLFNSGIVYKINNEIQPSMSLISLDKSFDYAIFNDEEHASAIWLSNYNMNKNIYSDKFRVLLLAGFISPENRKQFNEYNYNETPNGSFIYLGSLNVQKNQISVNTYNNSAYGEIDYIDIENLWNKDNLIYDNGGSKLIYTT